MHQSNVVAVSNLDTTQPVGLLDQVILGIRGTLEFQGQRQLDALKEAFGAHVDGRNNFHWEPEFSLFARSPAQYVSMCKMDFAFENHPNGRKLRNTSTIHLNPNRMIRNFRGKHRGLPLSLDQQENFLPPSSHTQATFDDQLRLVGYVTGNAFRELLRTLPEGVTFVDGELWVKSGELSIDIETPDAVALVRLLQRVALAGATRVSADLYRVSAENLGGFPVVRWWRQEKGLVYKVYAKTPTQVRCEVGCRDRKAIRLEVNAMRTQVSAQGVIDLLEDFSEAVKGALEELVTHVKRVSTNGVSPFALLLSLQPLIDLAAGKRTGGRGRPPGSHAQERAQAALDALLSDGSFQGHGDRKGEAVRSVLDGLSALGGPLKRECRRAVYTLDPCFAGTVVSTTRQIARMSVA